MRQPHSKDDWISYPRRAYWPPARLALGRDIRLDIPADQRPIHPRRQRASLPPRMRQLDPGLAPKVVDQLENLLEPIALLLVPQADVLGRDAPVGQDSRGLDRDQPRAAHRQAAQPNVVPVAGCSDASVTQPFDKRRRCWNGPLRHEAGVLVVARVLSDVQVTVSLAVNRQQAANRRREAQPGTWARRRCGS